MALTAEEQTLYDNIKSKKFQKEMKRTMRKASILVFIGVAIIKLRKSIDFIANLIEFIIYSAPFYCIFMFCYTLNFHYLRAFGMVTAILLWLKLPSLLQDIRRRYITKIKLDFEEKTPTESPKTEGTKSWVNLTN